MSVNPGSVSPHDHVSFDIADEAAEREMELQRLDKRTLTTVNLRAKEHAMDQSLGQFIAADFWSNLTVVTFPACFTNTLWRGMNLNGIAVRDSPYATIWDTTWEIATLVFILCATIDMLRQLFIAWRTSVSTGENASFGTIWSGYIENSGYRSSMNLGWKFFGGVVGWTAGYEIVAGTHPLNVTGSTDVLIVRHAIGAGIGTTVGLWLACESVNYIDYLWLAPANEPNHRGAIGVAFKGFWEGFVWSVIADNNVFLTLSGQGVALSTANFVDSIAVGFGSSPFFTLWGIINSVAGFYYLRSALSDSDGKEEYTPVKGIDDDGDDDREKLEA